MGLPRLGTRDKRVLLKSLWMLIIAGAGQTILPPPLDADGGTLRAANVTIGAYRVSVYTAPTPIRPDSIDVSVLVTSGRGGSVPVGLDIQVVAQHVVDSGRTIHHPATQDQAEDPRYYAAKFSPGAVGRWDILVRIRGDEGEGEIRFQVRVQEPGPLSNPFLVLTVALIPLVLVGWWLRRPPNHPSEEVGP
jgi:hypothetical protein